MARSLPLWFKGLTPELKKLAEDTLGETQEVRDTSILELRRLVEDLPDVRTRTDDVFLLRFLRTKKHDVRKSLRLLLNYHAFRDSQRGRLVGRTPSDVRHVVQDMDVVFYAPRRTHRGSHVAVYRAGSFDINRATAEDLVSVVLMVGEMILDCEATQVCGGIIVLDMGGMSMKHYTQFCTTRFASFVVSVVQDCLPERLKAVHIVNEPFLLHAIYKVIGPLLKKKLKERVHFHGHDLSSLHESVSRELLPVELGGDLGPQDNAEFRNHFFAQDSYIESINKYGLEGKKK
ncbi:hypothetical protein JTE90_011704 [Oedothorax gibbosus]|uniref:CRAL-TRIO domain-containing protein n=1 Tax=Oedothorax gibbosus TaxID=931172 RepID=A0AAV6USG4_9ARAC|nr:hypothetical protein JTE90_011704 [Oedothorax gibbosus]